MFLSSQDLKCRGIVDTATFCLQSLFEDGISGAGCGKKRHARPELHVIGAAKNIDDAFGTLQSRPGALDEAIAKNRVGEVTGRLLQIGNRMELSPKPAICGKTNHIQCESLRPF